MKQTKNRPLQLLARTGESEAELLVYGDITSTATYWAQKGVDDETDAIMVEEALASLPESVQSVTVRINSYGGDVCQGIAIYNALRQCGRPVTTVVDGFACSIASVVFMAGDRRVMNASSALMVHNPWMQVTGNSDELRKQADDLDKIAQLSYAAYERGGADRERIKALMDEETWVMPEEALELGFATEIAEEPEGPTQRARMSVRDALAGPPPSGPEPQGAAAPEPEAGPVPAPEQQVTEEPAEPQPQPSGFVRMAELLGRML